MLYNFFTLSSKLVFFKIGGKHLVSRKSNSKVIYTNLFLLGKDNSKKMYKKAYFFNVHTKQDFRDVLKVHRFLDLFVQKNKSFKKIPKQFSTSRYDEM